MLLAKSTNKQMNSIVANNCRHKLKATTKQIAATTSCMETSSIYLSAGST